MSTGIMTDSAVSVAANAVSANLYAGKLYEFPPRPSILRVRLSASAAGMNATLIVGGVSIVNDQAISQSNRWPVLPDDLVIQIGVRQGSRLILTLRNTTGGALTTNHVSEVIAVA
jgi:hypothetical protein